MDIRLLDDKKFKANLISNLMIVNYEGKHEQKYSINQIIMNQIVVQDNG